DYLHGNFGGGSGQNSKSKLGYGLVQVTDQPAFILRPFSQVEQISAAVDSLLVDLVYDPTQPGGGVSRILQLADAVGNTEIDNVNICSDQQWLMINLKPGGGGQQCQFIKKIDYTQSFGSEQKDIYLNVPAPGSLEPGIYYATVTF